MLNNYDIKYILRRVIVFFTIGLIMSFIGSCRVRAIGQSTWIQTAPLPNRTIILDINQRTNYSWFASYSTPDSIGAFPNYGTGELIFSFNVEIGISDSRGRALQSVYVTTDNNQHIFMCDIGTSQSWADNNKVVETYTARCPVNLNNTSLQRIYFNSNNIASDTNTIAVLLSPYITFVRDDGNDNSQVVSALNNIYSQILVTNDRLQHNNYQNDYILAKLEEIRLALANNQDLQEINDAIQSDNIDNNAVIDNTQGWEQQTSYVPTGGSGGSITDLLTLPIKLIQGFVNGLNSSCVPFNLGNLYGTDLILPCINISSFIGMPLWTTIDILFSGFMILHIGKKFVKIFNDFTNLRSNQMDDLYGGGN